MAATVANVVAKITANASGLKTGLDKAKHDIYEFKRDADLVTLEKVEPGLVRLEKVEAPLTAAADAAKDVAKQISFADKAFSGLNRNMRLLRGGGQLLGFALVGRGLRDATDNAVKLRDALDAADGSAGQLIEEIIAGIPLIGEFWKSGRNIKDLFTGDSLEVAKLNEKLKQTVALSEWIAEIEEESAVAGAPLEKQQRLQKELDLKRQIAEIDKKAAGLTGGVGGAMAAENAARDARALAEAQAFNAEAAIDAAQRQKELADSLSLFRSQLEKLDTPQERVNRRIKEMEDAIHDASVTYADWARVVQSVREEELGITKAKADFEDLQKRVADLGKTDTQRLIESIRAIGKEAGIGADEIARLVGEAEAFEAGIAAKQAAEDMQKMVDAWLEDIKTPEQKLVDIINKAREAMSKGLIDRTQFDDIIDAQEKLLGLVEDTQSTMTGFAAPGAVERGTAEAFRAEAMIASPLTAILDRERQAVDQRKDQIKLLRNIERNTDIDLEVRNQP